MTPRVLEALVAAARKRAARLPAGAPGPASSPPPSFAAAVSGRGTLSVIAEFDLRSPRAGAIREDDPVAHARLPVLDFAPLTTPPTTPPTTR